LHDQAESKRRMHAAGYVGPYADEGVEQLVQHYFSPGGHEHIAVDDQEQHVRGDANHR